jgi:hypothetical protein
MEKGTKIALVVAASGFAMNKYQGSKIKGEKTYLESDEQQLKMLGGGTAILGLASAGIIEFTKDKPKARKIAFVGLAGLTGLYFFTIIMALKKMS